MKIAILSRGPQLYSTQRLYRAGRQRGHYMKIVDHTLCNLVIEPNGSQIWYHEEPLQEMDAVIPRIGSSVTFQGAAVINHFELMGTYTLARSQSLLQARDKLRCLQRLAARGIPVPRTAYVGDEEDLLPAIEGVGGLPVVIKLLESTHGAGVLLAHTLHNAEATVEAFHRLRERVIIQEFIGEANGADIRALVVAGEIIASMKRQAQEGEFRSNLHRGASASRVTLTEEEKGLAINTVAAMGLDVAGVDLLRSSRGPLILEVNASPGLEGIETSTGVDVAGAIIRFTEKRVRAWKRKSTSR
jgi:ribosomal protein S6--L-glutamate ligase